MKRKNSKETTKENAIERAKKRISAWQRITRRTQRRTSDLRRKIEHILLRPVDEERTLAINLVERNRYEHTVKEDNNQNELLWVAGNNKVNKNENEDKEKEKRRMRESSEKEDYAVDQIARLNKQRRQTKERAGYCGHISVKYEAIDYVASEWRD